MRNSIKVATIAMLAGAALSVSACKKTDNTTADNSTMTEMNSTDTMSDTNDTMATESNMAMDNGMSGGDMNGSMNSSMDNSSMGTTNNAM